MSHPVLLMVVGLSTVVGHCHYVRVVVLVIIVKTEIKSQDYPYITLNDNQVTFLRLSIIESAGSLLTNGTLVNRGASDV